MLSSDDIIYQFRVCFSVLLLRLVKQSHIHFLLLSHHCLWIVDDDEVFIIAPSLEFIGIHGLNNYTDSHDDRRFQPSLHGKNNETPNTFDHLGYPLGDYEDPYTVASTYVKLHHIPHGQHKQTVNIERYYHRDSIGNFSTAV